MKRCEKEYQLLERIRKSDKLAFNAIYLHYYPLVFNHLYFQLRDEDHANDLTQETFIKCWENRIQIDLNKSFFGYILTIGTNLVKNYFKHQSVKRKHEDHVIQTNRKDENKIESDLNEKELRAKIYEIARNDLPRQCREIFIMSRFDGLSNDEIADLLNIKKKTVENQLYNALKVIRKKLEKSMGVFMSLIVII
ncbi:MAG: RNA polymerase sigma-70 factor [Bacteroidales bacterium]|nr:RNA polymerase sigma-70 factor [Bacteroidales bacterium]